MTALICSWDGEALIPLRAKLADEALTIGARYAIVVEEPRNMAAHRGFFARVHEAWQSMPADLVDEYPSSEHLRKRALIRTGYAALTDFVCATSAHAVEAAKAFTSADKYALVEISDRAVRIWRAESQSVPAMGSARFKQSVEDVERWIGDLLGTTPAEIRRAAA